ncbi:hypothetical protein [Natronoglycomyces albus]|uniref:Uncharacterized protein n=1 Tax=Natronoglycomyces albus TaxID=2811108 RepID=A0A895XRU3_9ACTN|nr:hypothetical protein [Natronoglycomyces albus]QSB06059.1 hypothetical protein JQS30_03820 [Natronoglycomyces albus]
MTSIITDTSGLRTSQSVDSRYVAMLPASITASGIPASESRSRALTAPTGVGMAAKPCGTVLVEKVYDVDLRSTGQASCAAVRLLPIAGVFAGTGVAGVELVQGVTGVDGTKVSHPVRTNDRKAVNSGIPPRKGPPDWVNSR